MSGRRKSELTLESATRELLAYCQANDWAGHDPYDALNSRLLQALPLLDARIPRLVLTQLLKRSPVNLRPLLRIPKTRNPKALGVFVAATVKLARLGLLENPALVDQLTAKLVELRAQNTPYWCWGYSFPWQTRTIIVPRAEPNLVCTTFIASALLDAYEWRGEEKYFAMALSAAEFILEKLYWTSGDEVGFCYPLSSVRARIHNANFLAAALFGRIYALTGQERFLEPALRAARYSAGKQHPDGSWAYGELPTQQWVDNFHTGYNLCALRWLGQALETEEFEPCIKKGFEFYRDHFFRPDGAARYFHNRTYPVDSHCVAQSLITLIEFKDLDADNVQLAERVFAWAMDHLWDERGYFYYRVLQVGRIKTSYMRWVQAWMLLGLTTLLEHRQVGKGVQPVAHPDRPGLRTTSISR
jgi:hypothetical protein